MYQAVHDLADAVEAVVAVAYCFFHEANLPQMKSSSFVGHYRSQAACSCRCWLHLNHRFWESHICCWRLDGLSPKGCYAVLTAKLPQPWPVMSIEELPQFGSVKSIEKLP